MTFGLVVLGALVTLASANGDNDVVATRYQPNWPSLGTRPLPSWYDKAKIGIFLHWGVYSVPSYENGGAAEWFWAYWKGGEKDLQQFMKQNYPPDITYQDLAPKFTAELYNPNQWADLFGASGAKYVILTTKHHEGYTLFPSTYSWNWNAKDVGPKRDLLGELVDSVRNRTDLRFGTYYSLYEWYNPVYQSDAKNKFQTKNFVEFKMRPELKELVNKYKPDLIWADGEWDAPDDYWNSPEFLAWLYNDSPVKDQVVVNSRWGEHMTWPNGCYQSKGDNGFSDTLQTLKWEGALTIDLKSWGYRRNAQLDEYLSIKDMIDKIVVIVSCGGNVVFNVGPTHDGRIETIFEERLRQMGSWLQTNGEAIYESVPWEYQNDTLNNGVWYTKREDIVYAAVLQWPRGSLLNLGSIKPAKGSRVTMLGSDLTLPWSVRGDTTLVNLAAITPDLLPSPWAWVLKFPSANARYVIDEHPSHLNAM